MISIIVPVYKAEKFLNRCVDSVIAQTYQDWELILVDDGSPDQSGVICDNYSRNDQRIKVFHKQNGGVSSARNLGLNNAQGEWITFVDADDYILPDYLERFITSADADLVISGSKRFGDSDVDYSIPEDRRYEIQKFAKCVFDCDSNENIYMSCVSYPWGKILKKSIIEQNSLRFNTKMKLGEDTCFMLDYLKYVANIQYLSGGRYMYYTSNASKSYFKLSLEEYNNHIEGISCSINALAQKYNQNSTRYFAKLSSMFFCAFIIGLKSLSYKEQCVQLNKFKQINSVPISVLISGMPFKIRLLLQLSIHNGLFFHIIIPVLYR